jgi:hypothetical protein
MVREIEVMKDRIFAMCGSPEPAVSSIDEEAALLMVTMQWRKPLSIEEVAQMAPTPEVRERRGRP